MSSADWDDSVSASSAGTGVNSGAGDEDFLRMDTPLKMRMRALFADCRTTTRALFVRILIVSLPIAVCLAVQIASSVTGICYACNYGIFPRETAGLRGILVWSFLHFGWPHFTGNATFLFGLGVMVIMRGIVDFILVWALATLVGGLGVWCTGGHGTVHAGASGVIMGLFGAVLTRVVFERSLVSLFWAMVVAGLYGSLFYIVIPSQAYSWQGHLWGLMGGILAAALLGCHAHRKSRQAQNQIGSDDTTLSPFDDFELDRGRDKLTDEERMKKEVEDSLVLN